MKIGVAGSVGKDHLMTFEGKFKESLVDGALTSVSLSFLVDSLEIRRGGCAANISFGMGSLGLNPILIAAVGKDWPDYDAWLIKHGVNTSHVKISEDLYTATFMVTTDLEHNQIASFFPGAMSEAREIDLARVVEKSEGLDLLIISPDDPEAMVQYSNTARTLNIPFAAESQRSAHKVLALKSMAKKPFQWVFLANVQKLIPQVWEIIFVRDFSPVFHGVLTTKDALRLVHFLLPIVWKIRALRNINLISPSSWNVFQKLMGPALQVKLNRIFTHVSLANSPNVGESPVL